MGNYKPWQVEKIACIYPFVRAKLNQVFNATYRDVHLENPVF